jgi:hypothetical protein
METKIKQVLTNYMELFDENTGVMGIPDDDKTLLNIARDIVDLFPPIEYTNLTMEDK